MANNIKTCNQGHNEKKGKKEKKKKDEINRRKKKRDKQCRQFRDEPYNYIIITHSTSEFNKASYK